MFEVGIILQILGILVGLASIERTFIARSYEEVRQGYLKAYRIVLSQERQLEKEGITIPELSVLPWFFKHSGARMVYFGIALNPRLRALTMFSYATHIFLDLLPLVFFGLLVLRRNGGIPVWLLVSSGFISVLWFISILVNIRSNWKLQKRVHANPTKRLIISVFRTLAGNVSRPIKNSWKLFLQAIDFIGMIPAMFVPGRLLPLNTSEKRRWYLLNVGSFYIIVGLLLQLYFYR